MIGSVRTDSSVLMDTRLAAVSLSCRNRVENIVVAAATGAAISTMQAASSMPSSRKAFCSRNISPMPHSGMTARRRAMVM